MRISKLNCKVQNCQNCNCICIQASAVQLLMMIYWARYIHIGLCGVLCDVMDHVPHPTIMCVVLKNGMSAYRKPLYMYTLKSSLFSLCLCHYLDKKMPYPAKWHIPANTTRWPNAGLMLAHCLRRWANISPALGQRIVFAAIWPHKPRWKILFKCERVYP